jgi:Transglycosylase SLT domain
MLTRLFFCFAVLCCCVSDQALCARDVRDIQKCIKIIALYERRYSIPKGILHSIALVETGTFYSNPRYRVPWPWTVNVEGRGRHFDTCQEAKAFIRQAIRKGQTNIDVGCMQINLRAHPNAFSSAASALDPENNIRYGAELLRRKYVQHGSWSKAVKCYHSSNPLKGLRYYYNVENARKEVDYGLALMHNKHKQFSVARASAPVTRPLISQVSFDPSKNSISHSKKRVNSKGVVGLRCSSFVTRLAQIVLKNNKAKGGYAHKKRGMR